MSVRPRLWKKLLSGSRPRSKKLGMALMWKIHSFVTGNHENYDALRKYPLAEWRGGSIRRIRPSVILLERGQIFDLGGKRFFTMGGASSHDIQDGILEPDDPLFKNK